MSSKGSFPKLNVKTPDGLRPGGMPYRVLVVEDKEFQRKQIVHILESEKYEIVGAVANGREAINFLNEQERPVDLLTTNLDMPVLDGYALLFELKEQKRRPIVVFISEETTKGVMHDLISMGIADFILKPINRRVILDRIRKVISKMNTA